VQADLIVNPNLRHSFEKEGYAVTPLLEPADVAELSAMYESFPSGMSTGFYTTLWSEDADYRLAVREVVTRVLTRRLGNILRGGRVILSQLAVKQAGGGESTCPMHSDWSFVDESAHQPISLWIPLVPITPEVGPLRVVPGSHRVFRRIRPNQPLSFHYSAFDDIMAELDRSRAQEVFLRAGDAILYDGAIIHGSRGNQSPRDRVAVVAVVVPQGAPLYHYWQRDSQSVEVFEVDEDFLATEVRWGNRPAGRRCIEILDLPPRERPLTMEDFDRELAMPTSRPVTLSGVDPWRAVSLDPVVQRELDFLGSSKNVALEPTQVDQLVGIYESLGCDLNAGFHADMFSKNTDYRRRVFESVRGVMAPVVARLMPDYEVRVANFIVKEIGTETSVVGLHQDWSIVDASRHRSFNIFIPLVDVDLKNGCLHVLDGSHRTPRRGPGPFHALPKDEVDQTIWDRLMRPVPMKRGEVLIYDSRLIHASPPNRSDRKRIAIGLICTPRDARLRFYHKEHPEQGTMLDVWPVDQDFFQTIDVSAPKGPASPLGRIDLRDAPITVEEIHGWLKSATSQADRYSPPPAFEELSTKLRSPVVQNSANSASSARPHGSNSPKSPRRIFHDASVESLFRHQGYVIVSLLDDAQVDSVYRFFHEHSPPNIGGFHGTMYHNDRDYRVRVDAILRPMLNAAAQKHLINYRCCMCNFMVKEPGEAASEMPLHQDWSFVKEPDLLAVHIWCPVVDVCHENGNLAVVPGSHHFSDSVRAFADDIPFSQQLDLLRERFTRELPIKAGQAVLFDGRLVHSSPPNMSSARRITAQAIGIPNESPIYHSWRCSPTQVETFQLPDDFFFDYVLHQRPQNIEPVEVVEYVPRHLSAEELFDLERYQEPAAAMKSV
jgi:ectoine hydroxylase-related dioxygenase (phytanoyl-CoA dioxygenase family)